MVLIAGLTLAVTIGGLLFWQSRSRKKTNTTLIVLNNQLDDANKVKARFFSILSHDLRCPIVNLVFSTAAKRQSQFIKRTATGCSPAKHQQVCRRSFK